MANIENRDLEQLLSTDNAQRLDAENRIRDNILDELENTNIRDEILNALRGTATGPMDVRNLIDLNFSNVLRSIESSMNNLTANTTDQREISRLNDARRSLRQRVNVIVRGALTDRINDLIGNVAGLTTVFGSAVTPPIERDRVLLSLRRKAFISFLEDEIARNSGRVLNNAQIRDILVGFYNNHQIFGSLTGQDRADAFSQVVGFSTLPAHADLESATITATIDALLARDLNRSSGTEISRIVQESFRRYGTWGVADEREQREINSARTLMDDLRTRLSNEVIIYNPEQLVDLLISDASIVAPFDSTERSDLINRIRIELGPIGTAPTAGQERTRKLARMFNLRVAYDATHAYQQTDTRQNVIDHLRTWQVAPLSNEIRDGLRNRLNELIDNSTDSFSSSPSALATLLSSYISEIRGNNLFGTDENQRMRNSYSFFYSVLNPAIRPSTVNLPINDNDLRTIIELFLNQGSPSILDSHNARIARINGILRPRFYSETENQAISLPLPLVDADVNNASNNVVQYLLNPPNRFTLDEIANFLSLPSDRRSRDDIVRNIADKIYALRTNNRFTQNAGRRLSNTEISTSVVAFLPNCERIIEELMRLEPSPTATNSYDYRIELESVLNNPSTNNRLYLRFKEVAARNENINDILMLNNISMLRSIRNNGNSLRREIASSLGFNPSSNLETYLLNDRANVNDCLNSYNSTIDYLREQRESISAIPETNRSPLQMSELEILNEILSNTSVCNDLFRNIAENFGAISRRGADDRARRLYNILTRRFNNNPRTASSFFLGISNNASQLEENMASCYKAMTAFSNVFVPRIEENILVPEIDPATGNPRLNASGAPIMINRSEAQRRPLERTREIYARNRRNLQKWMWFSRPNETELNDSGNNYLVAMRDYTYNQIQNEFPENDFTGSPEKIRQRQVDRRNRILELLNSERRELFDEELRAQTQKEGFIRRGFNKFRNGWRKHKMLRLAGAATCMGVAVAGVALGAPALALGTFVATGAVLRGVSTYMGFTAGWEAVRNKFGRTKRRNAAQVNALNPDELRESLASQATLALSEKGQPIDVAGNGVSPINHPMDALNRPVTDRNFDSAERPNVNAMFGKSYRETTRRPSDTNYYRQATARNLWARQNQRMRELIDTRFESGASMMDVLNDVYSEEAKLMDSIEKREVSIRKSNTKKHIIGASLGAFMGVGIPGISALKDWVSSWFSDTPVPVEGGGISPDPVPDPSPVPDPVPDPVPVPEPVPIPTEAKLIIPDRVYSPYVSNADLLANPGLMVDEDPGVWQSIANKLDMTYGTKVIDSNPNIKLAILAENPQLNGNLSLVRTGQAINISSNTAKMISDSLNTSGLYPHVFTPQNVLTRLHSPWPIANM